MIYCRRRINNPLLTKTMNKTTEPATGSIIVTNKEDNLRKIYRPCAKKPHHFHIVVEQRQDDGTWKELDPVRAYVHGSQVLQDICMGVAVLSAEAAENSPLEFDPDMVSVPVTGGVN